MKPAFTYAAKFRSAYDADTIRLDIDLGFGSWLLNQPIRLFGINAPEVRGPEKLEGKESRDFLRKFLEGNEDNITINTHKSSNKGKYGRYLVEITLDDGTNVNDLLVQTGHAVERNY